MSGSSGTPSDWVSGERVFAPPAGTLDVDWLVPAVLEAVPGASPAAARDALVQVWQDLMTSRDDQGPPDEVGPQADDGRPAEDGRLERAAARVVAEASRTFRA